MLSTLIAWEQKKDSTSSKRLLKIRQINIIPKLSKEQRKSRSKGNIYIPRTLRNGTIAWYHEYLANPGETHMIKTLKQTMYWPNLDHEVSMSKLPTLQITTGENGYLPLKQIPQIIPWQRVDVDFRACEISKKTEDRRLTDGILESSLEWKYSSHVPSCQLSNKIDGSWTESFCPEYTWNHQC